MQQNVQLRWCLNCLLALLIFFLRQINRQHNGLTVAERDESKGVSLWLGATNYLIAVQIASDQTIIWSFVFLSFACYFNVLEETFLGNSFHF